MSLEQWLQFGWLQRNETTVAEIEQLLNVVARDLADAKVSETSVDGRFAHAYDAALQICMVALRASGFRVKKGQGHHKRGIESLVFTLGEGYANERDQIETCSRLRGQSIYERTGVVEERDVTELIETAENLRKNLENWLLRKHPELVREDK